MKVAIDRDDLLNLLKVLYTCVDEKSSRPVHSLIKLSCTPSRVLFSAANDTLSMIKSVKAVTELPGMCTFPAKKMMDLVRNFKPKKNVILTIMEDGRLRVSQGRARYLLSTSDPEAFPKIEFFESDEYTSISPSELVKAIKGVFYATSMDDMRRQLNGVYLDVCDTEGLVRAVGTDGHRLACYRIPGVIDRPFLIPNSGCNTLLKILNQTEEVGIRIGNGNYASFCLDDGVFNTRLTTLEFPNYRNIFPKGKASLLGLDRESTIETFKRLQFFSGVGKKVNLKITPELVTIYAKDDVSEVTEELIPQDGSQIEEMEISFSAHIFLQAFEHLNEDVVTLRIYGQTRPIEISENNITKLIMPMK